MGLTDFVGLRFQRMANWPSFSSLELSNSSLRQQGAFFNVPGRKSVLGRQSWDPKTDNKTGFPCVVQKTGGSAKTDNNKGFPWVVQKTASSAVGSDGSFYTLPTHQKTCFSHIALHRCHVSRPHRARITTKLGECMLQ